VSWVPAETVLQAVGDQRKAFREEQARIDQFATYHTTERAKLEAEKAQAAHDLGQALLPSLDPPVIAKAAETSGLVGLPSENIPAKVEARRKWLVGRLREIEHDQRYAQRELLRHPTTGSLTRAIAENLDLQQPSKEVIATCDDHPRFGRLQMTGFDLPEFHVPWWRYSYWEDRSAANEIVAKFSGKTTFAEVLTEYASAQETLKVFEGELARLKAELGAVDALATEHDTLRGEYTHLDERSLLYTRGRIVDHLLGSDVSLVSQRLEATSAIRLLFLRASGITAKIGYLDGIEKANLTALAQDLAAARQKVDAVEQRTRKRWAPMPSDKFAKFAVDRRPRYEKRWQRIGKVYETVYVYDRYDRGRYYDDLLWWDLMTRGRYDGTFLPEVQVFYERHPDYAFEPDYKSLAAQQELAREDAQAAADGVLADTEPSDGPDATSFDAS